MPRAAATEREAPRGVPRTVARRNGYGVSTIQYEVIDSELAEENASQ